MTTPFASVLAADPQWQVLLPRTERRPHRKLFVQYPKAYYFADSEFYQIKGGFIAEVIQNPAPKFLEAGILDQALQELQTVTLAAFGKTLDEAATYASEKVMKKNVIFVDWLTVVRKDHQVVAFSSGSFIDRHIFYVHSTMVHPDFQSAWGLGIVPNIYYMQRLRDGSMPFISPDHRIVCRTRNRDVASLLTHLWKEMTVSGEDGYSEELREIFRIVAQNTDGTYDEESGIAREVYPEGLPSGNELRQPELNQVFGRLGVQDAYYIAGRPDEAKVKKILDMGVVAIRRRSLPSPEVPMGLQPAFNLA